MKKVYKYENSIVTVENCDTYNLKSIKKSTEHFLRQVIKERSQNGNSDTPGDIGKK